MSCKKIYDEIDQELDLQEVPLSQKKERLEELAELVAAALLDIGKALYELNKTG